MSYFTADFAAWIEADGASTSPSIYVNFHEASIMEVEGAAVCASFPVPLLTFSPGELSTIEGLHWDSSLPPFTPGLTKVFNFNDLPCPPQSVMVSLTITF